MTDESNAGPEQLNLEQRRASRPADLTETQRLNYDVEDLATEVHKLRGVMSAFAPRTEMSKEFDRRIIELENKLKKQRQASAQDRKRQMTVWVVSLLIIIASLSVVIVASIGVNRGQISELEQRIEQRGE